MQNLLLNQKTEQPVFIELKIDQTQEILGNMIFTLNSQQYPDICKNFEKLLNTTKRKDDIIVQKRVSQITGNFIMPNIQDCYCQFGIMKDPDEKIKMLFYQISQQYSDDQVVTKAKPGQLSYLKTQDSLEFIINYSCIQLKNCLVFGEVDESSLDVLQKVKQLATVDGYGDKTVLIVDSDAQHIMEQDNIQQ